MLQFVSMVMVAVSVLGNLWTPPVGNVFTKVSCSPTAHTTQPVRMPNCIDTSEQ